MSELVFVKLGGSVITDKTRAETACPAVIARLAREVASRGITVNAVAPGFIETQMTAVLSDKVKELFLAQIPLGRPGSPADVAGAVTFLASDQAAYLTGQVLHVSGGMYM